MTMVQSQPTHLDPAPFREWVAEQLENRSVGEFAHSIFPAFTPESAVRRLWRWRYDDAPLDRDAVADALHEADVPFEDVYPDEVLPDLPEDYCWTCRAFVAVIDHACCWCDHPIVRVELRDTALAPLQRRPPLDPGALRVNQRERPAPMPARPFYLDVRLDRRRAALETFAATASPWAAALEIQDLYASRESAAQSLRSLLIREGWFTPAGRGKAANRALTAAAVSVRAALDHGTWDRVVEQQPRPSQRTVIDERLVHEAAWLYFYDRLSFTEIARRLLPLSPATAAGSIKQALLAEWDYRGWPKFVKRAITWTAPAGVHAAGRCTATNRDGRPCSRWAQRGKPVCLAHDPARAAERQAANLRASRARLVPLAPWVGWLNHRVRELGSVRALHRRLDAVVSYDTLADWTKRYGGQSRNLQTVRRDTIDRVLLAWGDSTTFDDIYLPVVSDDQALVPQAAAA